MKEMAVESEESGDLRATRRLILLSKPENRAQGKAARDQAKGPGLTAAQRQELKDLATAQATQTGKAQGHFNFVKMHMLNHLHESILEFGSAYKYSTALGESAHMAKLKALHRPSNNRNVEPQIIRIGDRLHALFTGMANLKVAARQGYGGVALRDVLNLFSDEDQLSVDPARGNQQPVL